MALVDYSSGSEDGSRSGNDEDVIQPPSKRQKGNGGHGVSASMKSDGQKSTTTSSMPPLPDSFHDLYASTVRRSVVDDPSLHQGRKRQNPHVPGNWPSHVYVEWHPDTSEHKLLSSLVEATQQTLGEDIKLHSLLTSDLGAELPLHISLSRPMSLPTADKDGYLERVQHAVRSSGIGPFLVRAIGLAWFKSPDSDRSFLILRVATKQPGRKAEKAQTTNHELMALLNRCNRTASHFSQPILYQNRDGEEAHAAFHISIGWTFGRPDEPTCLEVLKLFKSAKFRGMQGWSINISGIKTKIGNVITHIPLAEKGKGGDGDGSFDSVYG